MPLGIGFQPVEKPQSVSGQARCLSPRAIFGENPYQHERHEMMTSRQQLSRRRFLGATTATAGGVLMAGARGVGAKPTVTPSDFPSTDHFWYRPQPAGPFVDSQRDNKAFGFADGRVFLSEDNGRTWPHSVAFPDARHIVFSCILKNGNILFSALAKTVPQHGQPENVQADHGEGCRTARITSRIRRRTRPTPAGTSIASRASTRGT